jgi:hypothetical protein
MAYIYYTIIMLGLVSGCHNKTNNKLRPENHTLNSYKKDLKNEKIIVDLPLPKKSTNHIEQRRVDHVSKISLEELDAIKEFTSQYINDVNQ